MRISNFGMGVLHVKVKYWRIFCDVISLLAQVFILSSNRVSEEVSMKFFYGSVFVIWLYFQKAMNRPCDLDLWHMKVNFFEWIENNPISILYQFQIDISSSSREIKYQNIGRTHRYTDTHTHTRHTHTHTHTDRVKTIPRNHLLGRGNKFFICENINILILWLFGGLGGGGGGVWKASIIRLGPSWFTSTLSFILICMTNIEATMINKILWV